VFLVCVFTVGLLAVFLVCEIFLENFTVLLLFKCLNLAQSLNLFGDLSIVAYPPLIIPCFPLSIFIYYLKVTPLPCFSLSPHYKFVCEDTHYFVPWKKN